MARLIDADEFERYIRTNCKDNFVDLWCELIRRQPTAYDVDKVVERLESMRDTAVKNIELNSQSYDIKEEIESARKHYEWIIQVVKSGLKE